jgi:molybdopterin-containing oxidoreductase family iron-sulfur binding subunit
MSFSPSEATFLNPIETGIGFAQGFAVRRTPDQDGGTMNRLYAVENHYTVTGGMADHRLRCKASDLGEFTRQLALALASSTGDANLAAVAKSFPESKATLNQEWVKECAADLAANKGRSIVLAGPLTPAPLQTLVNAINSALGNIGTTLKSVKTDSRDAASIEDLAAAINKGSVKTLFLLGVNPAQNAPANLDFANLLAKVSDTVHLGLFEDETAKASRWHVPAAHFLETWGDVRTFDGTYTSVQPMILPLWNGVSELEILNKLAGAPAPAGPALVRATFNKVSKDSSDEAWNVFLRDGFLPDSKFAPVQPTFNAATAAALAKQAQPAKADALELVFLQSSSVDDGRYANNSWLLETPDFVTKLTWDNAVLVSPATAKKLGIKANNFNVLGDIAEKMGNEVDYDLVADIVQISDGKKTIEAAAIVAPGHADDSLSIALGYGRKGVSALMDGVGFDALPASHIRCDAGPERCHSQGYRSRLPAGSNPRAPQHGRPRPCSRGHDRALRKR